MPKHFLRLTLLIGFVALTACETPRDPTQPSHPPVEERITLGLAGFALGSLLLTVFFIDGFSDGIEGIVSGEG